MSKNTDNLDMVTFQPFGEETLISNEEELKKTTSNSKHVEEEEISPNNVVKANKSKSEKFNGVIIGLILAFLFVAYDMFKSSF
jgi:hypothetical protein